MKKEPSLWQTKNHDIQDTKKQIRKTRKMRVFSIILNYLLSQIQETMDVDVGDMI